MNQHWRIRILVIILFTGMALLSWYVWHNTRDQVSQLVNKVEQGTLPDRQLITIKELWNTFNAAAASLKAYQSSSDENILAEFIDRKDSIQSVIDTLAVNAVGTQGALLKSLSEIVTQKAQLYHDLAGINYNRKVMQSLDRISELQPGVISDSIPVRIESGNLFQRMFSSRFSRKSMQARTDSLLQERNQRMEEYKKNIRKVKEEEERLLAEQQLMEAELLSKDQVLTEQAVTLIRELETLERQRLASLADELRDSARKSGEILQRALLIGLIAVVILLIVIFIEIEVAGRRKKQLAEARARSDKLAAAREEFMATMSHEIRTPLSAIIGFSEKLKNETTDEGSIKTASAILGSSRHLLAIVNDVLDFTRIESGKLRFSEESFRVDAVFAEVHEALSWKAGEKNIALSFYAQPVSGAILFGDPVRLKQVLYNLTGNAIKFTDKGSVTVTATLVDEQHHPVLIFKVSDTGCGISEDKLSTIFEEYEQADPNSEKGRAGTGLGLAISKRIIEQLNGSIEVESQSGLGSVFKVRVPYKWGDEQFSEQSFTEEPDSTALRGVRVLVAEDDPLIGELVVHYLSQCGAETESVADGQSALDRLTSGKYQLLIIDRQLPMMSGPEVIESLRAKSDGVSFRVPVIMMTAHIRPEDEASVQSGMFDGLIAKPFSGNELISKATEVLERRKDVTRKPTVKEKDEVIVPEPVSRPYDLSELYKASAGDQAYVLRMLNLFLTSTYASVNNLKFHLKTGNAEQIGKTAHKMLGSFRQLGLEELASELKKIEQNCESGADFETLAHSIEKLDQEYNNLKKQLTAEIHRINGTV